MTNERTRRDVVRTLAGAGALAGITSLAGCSSGSDDGDGTDDNGDSGSGNTVEVGPDGNFVFEPEEITVSTGDTVTWTFESTNHNVYAYPENHDEASIPDGADGFASVSKGEQFDTNDEGTTYEHTFETAGEYQYVCVPHAGQGMVGTVVVE